MGHSWRRTPLRAKLLLMTNSPASSGAAGHETIMERLRRRGSCSLSGTALQSLSTLSHGNGAQQGPTADSNVDSNARVRPADAAYGGNQFSKAQTARPRPGLELIKKRSRIHVLAKMPGRRKMYV